MYDCNAWLNMAFRTANLNQLYYVYQNKRTFSVFDFTKTFLWGGRGWFKKNNNK